MKTKNKIATLTAQHGDVKLRKLDAFPSGARKVISTKRCVLAEGEATGHSHTVEDDNAELIRIGERLLLSLPNGGTVIHEEHKPIKLAPGIWEVGQVREYDYFQQMARTVRD